MSRLPDLTPRERKQFVKRHFNFIGTVQQNLAERGIDKTPSTVSRTWAGLYRRPSREIVEELEAEYLRLTGGADAVPASRRSLPSSQAGPSAGESADPAKPAHVPPEKAPSAAPGVPATENPTGAVDGQSAASAAEMRYRVQIEEREEWLRKRRKKREDDEAWLRARQLERARGEAWLEERFRERKELDDSGLRAQQESDSRDRRERELDARRRGADENLKGSSAADFLLTLHEVAQVLAISESLARRILSQEPDVVNLAGPSSKRAILRVPVKVLQRIIIRGSVPWPTRPQYGGGR